MTLETACMTLSDINGYMADNLQWRVMNPALGEWETSAHAFKDLTK